MDSIDEGHERNSNIKIQNDMIMKLYQIDLPISPQTNEYL